MAKFPPAGSRRAIADFMEKKLNKKGLDLKVIQPVLLAFINDKFFWGVKIIQIDRIANINIPRKYEVGFAVISHKDEPNPKKFKVEHSILDEKKIGIVGEEKIILLKPTKTTVLELVEKK